MSLTQFSEPASRPLAEQHVLVIRLSAMGDVAIMAPVLNALLKQHPQLSVTLLTLAKWAPIFAAIPRLKTVPVETKGIHKGIIGLWRLSQSLKKEGFIAIADLHGVLRSRLLCFFLFLSGHKYARIVKGRAEKKALTRLENKIFKPLKHSSIRYGEVFAKLGFPITLDPSTVLSKPPKKPETTGADQSNFTTIGVAPFAAHKGKQYPLDLMIQALEIFSRLAGKDQKEIRFVFFGGGPVETPKIKALCKQFPHSSHGLSLSFEQELQVIAHLDFMVAMDSGNAHLAAMYAVPTLTLWGNTHPYAGFAPVFQTEKNRLLSDRITYPGLPTSVFGKEVPKGYEKVMESIAPAEVAEKMSALLREASAD
jgi:ADP-heptose:LPS heptosyltransferase